MKATRASTVKNREPDFEAWKFRFDGVLRTDLHAARSWKRLSDAGMYMDEVSLLLWLACDFDGSPGYEVPNQCGDFFTKRASEARRLSKRLEADAALIQGFFGRAAKQLLVDEISGVVKELRELDDGIRDTLSARKLNPSAFRAWLIQRIRETTRRSFYKELSFLLDVAYEGHDKEPPAIGADALRKSFQRSVKSASDSKSEGLDDPFITVGLLFIVGYIVRCYRSGSVDTGTTKKPDVGWVNF